MNIIKAQKEIFNSMLAGQRVHRFEIDESNTFITNDGCHGYVFPKTQIQINIEKIASMAKIDLQSYVKDENLCKLTNEAYIMQMPKRICRKLKRGNDDIYFNEKYMTCFQNPKFYSAGGSGMIVITEDISATIKNKIVGVIMPTRIH